MWLAVSAANAANTRLSLNKLGEKFAFWYKVSSLDAFQLEQDRVWAGREEEDLNEAGNQNGNGCRYSSWKDPDVEQQLEGLGQWGTYRHQDLPGLKKYGNDFVFEDHFPYKRLSSWILPIFAEMQRCQRSKTWPSFYIPHMIGKVWHLDQGCLPQRHFG